MHPLDQFHYCPKCGSNEFVINNEKSKHCNSCGFTYYFNPSAACAVFITDTLGRLLVAVRGKEPAKGTYDLPGGFADLDETCEDAAMREVLEETKLDVKRGTDVGVMTPFHYLFSLPNIYRYSEFDVHTLDFFFHVGVNNLDPYEGSGEDDVAELVAIPLSDLNPEQFGLQSIRTAVERYLSQPRRL